MTIEGREVLFMRADGTMAEHSVGCGGEDQEGNLMFFEIMDHVKPKLNGVPKYERIIIRRVFPCIEIADKTTT